MSDAITDVERDNEKSRLSKINVHEYADTLRVLRQDVLRYEKIKEDLIKLGYKVEESGSNIKIWKQI